MIKSIEMWDFESHKHTLVDGLADGLNTFHGVSNSGKTAIVRAIKLVAYNEFDKKSVRVGSKFCRVKIVTTVGSVEVKRGGDNNIWQVEYADGRPKETLDKVGKGAVPQACEIMGMHEVDFGDITVPVNIMDQLESHFMLSSVGGTKASGSVRAQILDALSGLSGIEVLIKAVSLDHRRVLKKVKSWEERLVETQAKMHDKKTLHEERQWVDLLYSILEEHEEAREVISVVDGMLDEYKDTSEALRASEASLASLKDTKEAEALISEVDDLTSSIESHNSLMSEHSTVEGELSVVELGLDGILDVDSITLELVGLNASVLEYKESSDLLSEHTPVSEELEDVTNALAGIPTVSESDCNEVAVHLSSVTDMQLMLDSSIGLDTELAEITSGLAKISDVSDSEFTSILSNLEKVQEMKEILESHEKLSSDLGATVNDLLDSKAKENKLLAEQNEIVENVGVCPLTLAPLSDECRQMIRTPVLEED